jgi:hypothetical protein
MPSASVRSGSAGHVGALLKDHASVKAAADVWYSALYHAQPSQSNQYLYAAMV